MKSPIGFVGMIGLLVACSETSTMTAVDAGNAIDVVDAMTATDVTDVTDARDATDVPVDAGVRCGTAEIGCVSGTTILCANLQLDPQNCGVCGRACCPGQACAGGSCVTGCPAGQTVCAPTGATCPICVDTSTSTQHCGRCNLACATGQVCVRGACAATACSAVTEPPSPMGVCDGRGRSACEMWAQGIAGGRSNVTAQCLSLPAGCAKADHCDDPNDVTTCRCGVEPVCGPNQVYALVGPTARCECAQP